MLFLFEGRYGPIARAIAGVILLVVGIAIHGGPLLAGSGVVLLLWGAAGALSYQRARRQARIANGARWS